MSCQQALKAARKVIEKNKFYDGRGQLIARWGKGLDKNTDVTDDRNVASFFKHRWLIRLKQMKTLEEVEKQVTSFLKKLPMLGQCGSLFDEIYLEIIKVREKFEPKVAKVVGQVVRAPVVSGSRKNIPTAAVVRNNENMAARKINTIRGPSKIPKQQPGEKLNDYLSRVFNNNNNTNISNVYNKAIKSMRAGRRTRRRHRRRVKRKTRRRRSKTKRRTRRRKR